MIFFHVHVCCHRWPRSGRNSSSVGWNNRRLPSIRLRPMHFGCLSCHAGYPAELQVHGEDHKSLRSSGKRTAQQHHEKLGNGDNVQRPRTSDCPNARVLRCESFNRVTTHKQLSPNCSVIKVAAFSTLLYFFLFFFCRTFLFRLPSTFGQNILSLALTADGLLLSRPAEAPKQLAFLACFLTASRMQNKFAMRAADVWVVFVEMGGWVVGGWLAIAVNESLLHTRCNCTSVACLHLTIHFIVCRLHLSPPPPPPSRPSSSFSRAHATVFCGNC